MPTATTSTVVAQLLADAHRLFQRDRIERIDDERNVFDVDTRCRRPLATIFWSVSGTRLVGTRIFMATNGAPATGVGRSTLP